MKRQSRVRRLALQGLCCLDSQGESAMELVDDFIADSRQPLETVDDARKLLRAVWAQREMLDASLTRHARNWQLHRLALVDRNVLRLAAYEMFETAVPHKVAITEAMALAGDFSTAESPRFVNAICDAIAKEIQAQTQRD
ncbi:MAG: transcription antitermination factor NusB [Phycisphaerae bacterium]